MNPKKDGAEAFSSLDLFGCGKVRCIDVGDETLLVPRRGGSTVLRTLIRTSLVHTRDRVASFVNLGVVDGGVGEAINKIGVGNSGKAEGQSITVARELDAIAYSRNVPLRAQVGLVGMVPWRTLGA